MLLVKIKQPLLFKIIVIRKAAAILRHYIIFVSL